MSPLVSSCLCGSAVIHASHGIFLKKLIKIDKGGGRCYNVSHLRQRAIIVHPVRQEILTQLKKNGQATVAELASHLQMAPVSVRHHLDLLIADNLVYSPRVRKRAGVGRPQQVYVLTPEATQHFPNNYRQLASASLQALKAVLGDEGLKAVMEQMAQETVNQAPGDLQKATGKARLPRVTAFLNELGYMAEWQDAADAGAVLVTCNCPYAALVSEHPELCHLDIALVQLLTGATCKRVSHIAQGDQRCMYDLAYASDPAPSLFLPTLAHGIDT